ncbi:hypothetical protein [Agaribacterium sp. ZY112]|uniref:hypothetical protein n=1 Tax=Agaribacterium sp. ZY112 TaxID=3233574 RepID=UPI0035267FE4
MRIILLLLCVISPSAISGVDLDPYISNVVTFGKWEEKDKSGQIRFITKTYGSEHVYSKLFIQWLTYHEDGVVDSKVVSETSVKELNEKYYSFGSPVCVGDWKCQSFELRATDAFSYTNHKFIITLQGIGLYTIVEKAL